MQKPEFISIIITVLTSLGGFTFIHQLMNRRWEKQRLTAENQGQIEEIRRRQIDWLEKRINERDRRIETIFQELHKEQKGTIELIRKFHEMQLRFEEERRYRCEVQDCNRRTSSTVTEKPDNKQTKKPLLP